MSELSRKALEMRKAIDMIEGALMGFGDLVDLPRVWDGADDATRLLPSVTLGQVRRLCKALDECTRIINAEEFNPKRLR